MAATIQPVQGSADIKPVIFALPGIEFDTSLQVFDQTFHVHSNVLKTHSAFFRTFLDSADKSQAYGTKFRYAYKTKVDSDGVWGLEAATKVSMQLFLFWLHQIIWFPT
jgi:hypothetical protein